MDMRKLQDLIGKMVHPGATVNSLIMFANKVDATYGHEGLRDFFAALCRMDIHKAVTVSRRLNGDRRSVAEDFVYQALRERCESEDGFSHLELLAIGVCQDAALLQTASPLLTQQIVEKTIQSADELTACSLLRMSFSVLPQESCAWVREEFCKLLSTQYNERMEKALPELLPCLLEHEAEDVLSALVEIAGAERVSGSYGEALPEELDRLIRSGKDSVGVWELYFCCFFRQTHTQEELLNEGLWYVQLFAGEDIYDQVCASFFLHAATRYGVEHPIFDCIEDFIPPQKNTRQYILRYKDALRALWGDPGALCRFLEKTAPCNPFREQWVQGKRYYLLQRAQDRTAYSRLQGLYEAGLPAGDILNIFFSTDLKKRLPLEDVFYLAQRYEVLPEFLEALRDQPFTGTIAAQDISRFGLQPHIYFSAALHTVPITYRILEIVGRADKLKGRKLQYVITDFYGGYIQVSVCGTTHLTDGEDEDAVTWEAAIAQLRQEKKLSSFTRKQLKRFAVTEFTLDDVLGESDLNLFTGLVMERPDCLEAFAKLLNLCKWNASFLKPELPLPKNLFGMLQHYRQEAVELFRFLLQTRENTAHVLQLYFSSIYRAIVPLNQLLMFAPRERLLEQLPKFAIHCRLIEAGSARCRLPNITYASVCVLQSTEGISLTDPFSAEITDFTVEGNYISRILLQRYKMRIVDIKKHGALFGYLASKVPIDQRREQLIAALPSAADCGYRELKFNIRCMEDAVLLRRSNAPELKRLIQVLGDANPFAFGVSFAAERVYLSKKKRKEDTRDSAVSMVLNAKSIEDIRDFYLHTHIRFHLQLPRLAALIRERRADLEDQIPGMFDGVTFLAIADSRGGLWMPWVEQNTLQVSREYAGQVLSCEVRLEKDGTVSADVKQAEQSDVFFKILESCLLSGYQTDQDMDALLESLRSAGLHEEIQQEETTLPENGELSYLQYYNQMRRIPHNKQFSHEDFARDIQRMIVTYHEQSAARMRKAVIKLTRIWLQQQPDREKIPPLLHEICRCFIRQHQESLLCNAVAQLLHVHFGTEYAQAFQQHMQEYAPRQEDKNDSIREWTPFEQACEVVQSKIGSTFFVSRRLLKLINSYHDQVSREEMEAALSVLTAQWMQTHMPDDAQLNELLNIHTGFIEAYQSGSFGLILCQQAYQFLPESAADKLERGVCKITYQSFADHPELNQMLPPFEQQLARLQARLGNRQYENNDTAKRIGRMIRYYGRFISADEMERTVLALTEQFANEYKEYPHTVQLIDSVHTAFESSYGTPNMGKSLWQQYCQLLQRDISCAAQMSQPMPVQDFSYRILRLIPHKAYFSAEEMKQTILALTAQWIVGATDEEKVVSCLVGIHKCYAEAYVSAELGSELRRLGEQHLKPGAVNRLNMRIKQSSRKYKEAALAEANSLTPLDIRKEQISQCLSEPEFREKNYINKLHKLIHRYADAAPAEEIARTVAELAEQWMLLCPDEAQLMYILHGLHDCFMKYCGTDHLAGLFCQLLGKHLGEDAAKAFAERLQESNRRLQGEEPPAEPDHTERT